MNGIASTAEPVCWAPVGLQLAGVTLGWLAWADARLAPWAEQLRLAGNGPTTPPLQFMMVWPSTDAAHAPPAGMHVHAVQSRVSVIAVATDVFTVYGAPGHATSPLLNTHGFGAAPIGGDWRQSSPAEQSPFLGVSK